MMKVKLIQMTENPIDIMWTAARTCYSTKGPIEMFEDRYGDLSDGYEHTQEYVEQCIDKHWNLVKKVLDSGHQSIAEHVYFTFAIEGISRACSHQLVRHRAGIVFSQQSQRYVEIKEDYNTLIDLRDKELKTTKEEECLMEICQKYFVDVTANNYKQYLDALITYLYEVQINKNKPEDARQFLPNATKTNITMSVNFRELIHLCNLRLCTRAQKEIRDLFKLIVKEVKAKDAKLASYLVPTCEIHGACFEHNCCSRKPKFEDIIKLYEDYKKGCGGLISEMETQDVTEI